ncbi:type I-E CRISPR-associated protein Cas6/Cse3/CasE, partial [Streptomyces albidoflavus]|uniref:type I-E CRISPR-associated protein Cas6/Cse3/CasE n=1 Tax=Streptomyces albidoflavus TaxID=1886 RepID=UPI00211C95A8
STRAVHHYSLGRHMRVWIGARCSRPCAPCPFFWKDWRGRAVRITARHRQSFQKNGHGAHVVFHSATFEGRLRITDTDRFTTSLLTGLGPSRAYGCGLLTLAPLPGQQT